MKKIKSFFQFFYYLLKALIYPKNAVYSIIKFGDLLSDTKCFKRSVEKLKEDPQCSQLISDRYSMAFDDLEKFKDYRPGTLGHEYYQFMSQNGFSCYFRTVNKELSEAEYVRERRRELHDLLHLVLGYDTQQVGEAQINTFLWSQAKMPTCIIIVVGIILRFTFKRPQDLDKLFSEIIKSYVRAQNTPSVYSIKWEEYLDQPMERILSLYSFKPISIGKATEFA